MSTGIRALIGVAAIAVAVVLFVVLQDSGSDNSSSPTTAATTTTQATTADGAGGNAPKPQKPDKPEIPTIQIRGGEPVGGVAELEFEQGEKIEFYVDSDVADHVHLHGYDVFKDVAAGQRIKFSVPATDTGVFEAELEDRVVPIAEITVQPG